MSTPSIAVGRRPLPSISGQTFLLVVFAAAAAIFVGLVGLQSRHAFTHAAAPVLLAPIALWMFFSERYAVTLAVLLLYLGLFDGVLKLASGSNVATLGRDILLYAITLGAVVRMILRKTPVSLPPFTGIVLAWVAVCVMQVANPADISLTHAVASLRQHLEFVPLFFFGYVALRSKRRLAGLMLLLVIIAAGNGIVSLVQSHLTPAQLASWGPGYAALENGSGTEVGRFFYTGHGTIAVRPPGLGGEDGFGGVLGMIAIPGAIVLLSSAQRSFRLAWLLIPATILTIVAVVTSQTRLAILGSLLVVFAFLALTITSRRGLVVLLLTALFGLAGYFIASDVVSSTANRYSSIAPSKVLGTAVSARQSSLATIPAYLTRYPLGAGLGSVGPAAGSTVGSSGVGKALNGETEFTFLLVETGIPGLVVMLAFVIATIRGGLAMRRVADPGLQRCLMALTAVLIGLFFTWAVEAATSLSPTAPLLWLAGGCLAYWYGELRAGSIPLRPRLIRDALASR
jgi:hypothetical protein